MQAYELYVNQKTSPYLVWSPCVTLHEADHLRNELIRLLIVACGLLSHSSSMAVRSCWILVLTGTRCSTRRSRASQTCSLGDMFGEYAGHGRTETFSASSNCVQIVGTCIIMLKHEVMAMDEWHNSGPRDLVTVSLSIQIAIDKMRLCLLSVAYACPCITPLPPWGTLFTSAYASMPMARSLNLRHWWRCNCTL
jgi:hypothetical protein